jgi:hypothetical protein
VPTKELLLQALASEAAKHAVIHISGHGNDQCFSFTNNDAIPWMGLVLMLVPYCRNKAVVLSACDSYFAQLPAQTLSDALRTVGVPAKELPSYLLTVLGKVSFADNTLAWGIFYRHLMKETPPFELREVRSALEAVKGANLAIKICAVHCQGGSPHNISPWP